VAFQSSQAARHPPRDKSAPSHPQAQQPAISPFGLWATGINAAAQALNHRQITGCDQIRSSDANQTACAFEECDIEIFGR